MSTATGTTPRVDVYTRVTDCIVADLDRGVRPWLKPWNAENAVGRITRPCVIMARNTTEQ
jgi:antirestriction protein ArdC